MPRFHALPRRPALFLLLGSLLVAAQVAAEPPSFGRCYPHLAVSNAPGECGIGAVIRWAERLWFIPSGTPLRHEFPRGYLAQWVRLTAATECTPTATRTER
ncbi:MAG: hypothetical protein ACKOC8_00560 [Pirellulales bacterium]